MLFSHGKFSSVFLIFVLLVWERKALFLEDVGKGRLLIALPGVSVLTGSRTDLGL